MGISPTLWGREAWIFIHYVALSYIPSEENEKKYLVFFESLPNILPCPVCGNHFLENMKKNPPKLNSSKELFRWTVDMHNLVNEKNGKKKISYSAAYNELKKRNSMMIEKDNSELLEALGLSISISALVFLFSFVKY